MSELEEKAVTAEERVRLYRELLQGGNVGGELVYDKRFHTEAWPRTVYALTNTDLDEVLDELAKTREENLLQRQDLENAQNQREDLEEKVKTLETKARKQEDLVLALRRNGGEHWFAFGYDKPSILGSRYARYCRVCDKEEGDLSHFGNGVTALSSKAVEEAVEAARLRLVAFVAEGLKMGVEEGHRRAQSLLGGLPGIPVPEGADGSLNGVPGEEDR